MASKYLTGTYGSGYTLTGSYSEVTIGTTAFIGGTGLVGGTNQSYAIVNFGRVAASATAVGTYADGIKLQAGGTIVNGSTNGDAALIAGSSGASNGGVGIRLAGGGSISNWGTVAGGDGSLPGAGIQMTGGGAIRNWGTVAGGNGSSNTAGGAGRVGVLMFGGSIANYGVIAGGTGGNGSINSGGGGGAGIGLSAGGSISNWGTIAGRDGGLDGLGNQRAGGEGIALSGNGAISNWGRVAGGAGAPGIEKFGVGIINNLGTVTGGVNASNLSGGPGIMLYSGGTVTNGTSDSGSALIAGRIGVKSQGTGGATVTNYGTIVGSDGVAVSFNGSGSNLLALGAGFHLAGTVQGSIAAGATDTLELLGGAGHSVIVDYNALGLTSFEQVLFGTGGYSGLLVANTGTLGITISGFEQTSETIDLTAIGTDGTISYSNSATDRITVTGSLGSVTLQFDSIDGLAFTTAGDGTSGTNLIACFCRGTLIQTTAGEVAVEDLAIGARVVTHFGEARNIRWIGKRAYDSRFVAGNKAVLPIRIATDALADGVPACDLWLSPEHSLYFDGVLAKAVDLINGLTIVHAEAVESIEYFHIELDSHDILIANGAPAESFVDCDNRLMFENGAEYAALYPEDDRQCWAFCANRLACGDDALMAIRARLLARAAVQGRALTSDPDFHLVVDGVIVRSDAVEGDLYRFTLRAARREVWLTSRSSVPADVVAGSQDVRRLGVPIERIVLCGDDMRIEIAPDCLSLHEGFHDSEGSHRWTNGRGALPSQLLTIFHGDIAMEIQIGARHLPYPATTLRCALAG